MGAAPRCAGSARSGSRASRARRSANAPARDDLRAEDDDDVRAEGTRRHRAWRRRRRRARNSTKRVTTRALLLVQRAGLEEGRLPDEGEPQRRPEGRRAVGQVGARREHAASRARRVRCGPDARVARAPHPRHRSRRSAPSTTCATRAAAPLIAARPGVGRPRLRHRRRGRRRARRELRRARRARRRLRGRARRGASRRSRAASADAAARRPAPTRATSPRVARGARRARAAAAA